MRIAVLYNVDYEPGASGPGLEARADVGNVADAVARAVRGLGHTAALVGVGAEPLDALQALRDGVRPDLVFNLCESVGGDARGELAMAAALQLAGVPFTGSDALTLGLALHKDRAKALLRQRGVPTPDGWLLEERTAPPDLDVRFPVIVKPAREDGSLGISFDSVVHDHAALWAAVRRVWQLEQPALVEAYVEGQEVMVSFLGNAPRLALPLREIAFGAAFEGRPRIVSYRAKWDPAAAECQDSASVPCRLSPEAAERVVEVAFATCDALGCRDYGRVDLRLSAEGVPFVIDVNPNCDLHPEAGYARAAAEAGLAYPALVARIAEVALERSRRQPGRPADDPGGPPAAARAPGAGRRVHGG